MVRVPIVALVAGAVLAASACGGGDGDGGAEGTAPDEYAATVCGALTDWQNELQSSVTSMTSEAGSATSPADVKTNLVEFMDAMSKSTDTMVSKVRAAGAPDIDDGEALHQDLVSGLEDAQQAFAEARDKAQALPTDDPASFQRQAQELNTTLSREGSAIGSTFSNLNSKYDSDELDRAFNDEPACQNLSGS